ncbi:MAG TPA: molecular chaperone DnaK, partial [Clostridiales bacterium]|nr:molecular chaperone DnaK [Clostridiales bacterium]
IDANGIVHVSAKDMGTGHEQKVTITASTNLTDAEVDKAVKEAEKFAAEDKKNKENVEVRNNADNAVYQAEKTLKDVGDKLDSNDKAKVQAEIDHVKEALKGNDTEKIKNAADKLQQVFYDLSSKIYQQNPNMGQNEQGHQEQPEQDNVYDADYEVVDDEDEKK